MSAIDSLLRLGLSIALVGLAFELDALGAPNAQQLPQYSVHDLGALHGGSWTVASGINNQGVVTGSATTLGVNRDGDGPIHPFIYRQGRVEDLGLLPGHLWGSASRINDRGQIIGYQFVDYFGPGTPFIYADGRMLKFADVIGDSNAYPSAINNQGAVVGTIQFGTTGDYYGFIYTNGTIAALPRLVPGGSTFASDVNDRGAIVGYAETTAGSLRRNHAFLLEDGKITDLGVLPGLEASSAHRITQAGHVLGNCNTPTPERVRGFLYRDGQMTDIGTLPGDTDCVALEINNRDEIVGTSYYNNGGGFVFRAALWTGQKIWDLQLLVQLKPGWSLQNAVGINDRGQILVIGQQDYGPQRTLLLTPH